MPDEAPFTLSIPDDELDFLKKKLELTRLPDELEEAGRIYGTPLADVERLTKYWKDVFLPNWREHEAKINEELPQFTRDIEVEGHGTLNIHYVHKKSAVVDAIPLLFIHGWPGSFLEVRKILPLLTAASPDHPSFHVVAFSLPGYGFSDAPKKKGFGVNQFTEVGHKLMLALGYNEYVAQGGDWGSLLSRFTARLYGPKHCKAWHTNMPGGQPPHPIKRPLLLLSHLLFNYDARDKAGLKRTEWFSEKGCGYFHEQTTQPQTLGYSLADSPVGLLAWIYEKLVNWTDEYPWTEDEALTWVSMYWFSKAGPAASLRIYFEIFQAFTENPYSSDPLSPVPIGYSYFPQDILVFPRSWVKTTNLVFESQHERGGHFAAHETPELLVGDLRQMFGRGGPAFGVVPGKTGFGREKHLHTNPRARFLFSQDHDDDRDEERCNNPGIGEINPLAFEAPSTTRTIDKIYAEMAQSQVSSRSASTSPSRDSSAATSPTLASFSDMLAEKQFKGEEVQEAYIESKDRLVNAIDATKSILNSIRAFNRDDWVVRYPQLKETTPEPEAAAEDTPSSSESATPSLPTRFSLKHQRRSLSFADDPSFETEVVVDASKWSPKRSVSMPVIHDEPEQEAAAPTAGAQKDADAVRLLPASDFNVLRLDLKLGAHSSSSSAASLVSQLEKASIANLLDERIASSLSHIEKLRLRVEDTSSKVLVTGDLNAGKSTFVNALLRREVMPVDQQPCTTAFCEVHDAAENNGVEEVHLLHEGVTYDINDDSTFTRHSLEDLESIVEDHEHKPVDQHNVIKLYLADTRAPSESLLNNGVVDISLIDAPGLNRDSLKTTAVFARQEEIDVVVFVVSAENHFTLSSKEFLMTASNEKAYVFIVVNKFAGIKNKERCRKAVLDQIKQLSPGTYEDAEDLVHFVDSAAALQPYTANPEFDDLESALRSFVLVKRSKSKLQPVSTYLSNLLSDIDFLARANIIVADTEIENAQEDLAQKKPILEKMKKFKDVLENAIEQVEEDATTKASDTTKSLLNQALERVGQGKLGVDVPSIAMPSYPGLLGIWDYARDVRRALLSSIDDAVRMAEDEARMITKGGVERVKELGEEHLPAGVERNTRVFMPEAMFSVRRKGAKGTKSRRSSGSYSHIGNAIVAGGLHGLGIGLAQRHDLLETTFFDLFDVNHQFFVHFGDGKQMEDTDAMTPSAFSVASVGIGALTMVGGQALGARAILEGIVRVTDLLSNETARKWAAPVLGAVTLGATAYLILELPSSIPRTVGRRVKASIVRGDGSEVPVSFVDAHATRVGKETRKVLRLVGWDLRERFRTSMDERSKEVKVAEDAEKKATKAKEWFGGVATKVWDIKESVSVVA